MNKVVLMGRLTKDPEMRYTQGENAMAITRYSLAVDRKVKQGEERQSDFINCVCFGKSAEFAEKHFQKGKRILISGRIQTGSYTNKDGQKVYTTDIVVEEQEFADSKASDDKPNTQNPKTDEAGFMDIPDGVADEGLPFN